MKQVDYLGETQVRSDPGSWLMRLYRLANHRVVNIIKRPILMACNFVSNWLFGCTNEVESAVARKILEHVIPTSLMIIGAQDDIKAIYVTGCRFDKLKKKYEEKFDACNRALAIRTNVTALIDEETKSVFSKFKRMQRVHKCSNGVVKTGLVFGVVGAVLFNVFTPGMTNGWFILSAFFGTCSTYITRISINGIKTSMIHEDDRDEENARRQEASRRVEENGADVITGLTHGLVNHGDLSMQQPSTLVSPTELLVRQGMCSTLPSSVMTESLIPANSPR